MRVTAVGNDDSVLAKKRRLAECGGAAVWRLRNFTFISAAGRREMTFERGGVRVAAACSPWRYDCGAFLQTERRLVHGRSEIDRNESDPE